MRVKTTALLYVMVTTAIIIMTSTLASSSSAYLKIFTQRKVNMSRPVVF